MCDEAGEPYHPSTLTHNRAKVAKAAGVRHIRLHDCRYDDVPPEGSDRGHRGVVGSLGYQFHSEAYAHSQNGALREVAKTLGSVVTTRDAEAN